MTMAAVTAQLLCFSLVNPLNITHKTTAAVLHCQFKKARELCGDFRERKDLFNVIFDRLADLSFSSLAAFTLSPSSRLIYLLLNGKDSWIFGVCLPLNLAINLLLNRTCQSTESERRPSSNLMVDFDWRFLMILHPSKPLQVFNKMMPSVHFGWYICMDFAPEGIHQPNKLSNVAHVAVS